MAKSKQPLTRDELRALSNKQIAADVASTKYAEEQLKALETATLLTVDQRKEARQAEAVRHAAWHAQNIKDRRDWQAVHAKVKDIRLPR